jgi:hypothetical protein
LRIEFDGKVFCLVEIFDHNEAKEYSEKLLQFSKEKQEDIASYLNFDSGIQIIYFLPVLGIFLYSFLISIEDIR